MEFSEIFAKHTEGINSVSKIDTSIDISSIEVISTEIPSDNFTLLKASFTFGLNFAVDFAKISLMGYLVLEASNLETKRILEGWKTKKLPDEFRLSLLNMILRKCTIKALELEDELNIPAHLHLPSFGKKKDK